MSIAFIVEEGKGRGFCFGVTSLQRGFAERFRSAGPARGEFAQMGVKPRENASIHDEKSGKKRSLLRG